MLDMTKKTIKEFINMTNEEELKYFKDCIKEKVYACAELKNGEKIQKIEKIS